MKGNKSHSVLTSAARWGLFLALLLVAPLPSVAVGAVASLDFGDAPDVYATSLTADGARHAAAGPTLGAYRDNEADGQPSADANGDDTNPATPDDENGVEFASAIVVGQNASVSMNVQNAPGGAKLDAWIDFDGNDSWTDAGDQIANSVPVANGDNTITFSVPGTAVPGNTYARFRLSTTGRLGTTGQAADGEVEDYHVTISPASATTRTGTLDTIHYIPPFYAVSGLDDYPGNHIRDHYLALSTPETTPFDVRIANAARTVDEVTISKTSPVILNLSADPYGSDGYGALGIVDDGGLNQVNATDGLILTADKRFYANSRHRSESQAFSLTAKGQTALGTRFRSGHLNTRATSDELDSVRGHFISVMAAQDNTTVTFSEVHPGIVFRDGSGTFSGTPGPVTLNRGESYVVGVRLENIDYAYHNNLNGTLVTSDKPIVVNSGSWTAGNGRGQDIGADQILPVNLIGTEYILQQGRATGLAEDLETPIVVADSDNTQIWLSGNLRGSPNM